MTKTLAMDRVRRAIESRCNRHGYIQPSELRDVLADLLDELASESDGDRNAQGDDKSDEG